MKKISSHTFKHILSDIHKNTENRRFCFVIGAGASFKSGIPTGGQLAEKWYEEIKERYSEEEIDQWVKDVKLNKEDLAAHYGSVYRKRFESDKTSGYEFLVQAMKSAKPTFGHIVLAHILTKAPGNCVLTTNFDSLIETSIYQFTDKTPLVCGHESLSGYARPSNIHPLIIKIHRDLLLSPKSDPDEINKLDDGWKEPLDNIFSSHIPIVIGYGGNDGSLMDYLEQMSKPSNFFWCGRKGNPVSNRIEKLVEKFEGSFVEIEGFDKIMQELLWVFDKIKPIKEELDGITKSRIEAMNAELHEMNLPTEQVLSSDNITKKELSAFEYATLAENETDYEKREAIYLEALENFPNTVWLWNEFTYFLHFVKKDYSNLENYYIKALSIDSEDPTNIENYANFLNEIKKDYINAEKYYLKALSIEPDDVISNGNYAIFLDKIKKDYETAEKHYLKALSIDPDDAVSNGNYANFLRNEKKDFEGAEKYYIKALSIEPEDANRNGSYADFLSVIKKDYLKAEKYYHKALSIKPENVDIIGSYANFLSDVKKDYLKAEKQYLKALSIDPENTDINGNYGIFLYQIKKDYKKAEKHYLKALSIDPNHENNNGNYARFLSEIKNDYENAGKFYLKALSIDPQEANNNGNYAQFLLITERSREALSYLELAFKLNKDEKNDLLVELWFYKYAHYLESLEEAEKTLEELLNQEYRSIGWDLTRNVEIAVKNGHPNPKKLKELAKRITTE